MSRWPPATPRASSHDFEECFDMLDRMNRDEHDALLREAGILDQHGDLAARYRPVEARDTATPGPTAATP